MEVRVTHGYAERSCQLFCLSDNCNLCISLITSGPQRRRLSAPVSYVASNYGCHSLLIYSICDHGVGHLKIYSDIFTLLNRTIIGINIEAVKQDMIKR